MTEDSPDDISKGLGSKMTIAGWIILLGILTFYFSGYLEQQRNPNQSVDSTMEEQLSEVVLKQNRQGHYIATAVINNIPVNVILDTGASDVSIPEKLAEKLRLTRGPSIEAMTANGTISVYLTTLDSVQLGHIELKQVKASINPYSNDSFILLGMSFLRQVEFTQRNNTLILRQYH